MFGDNLTASQASDKRRGRAMRASYQRLFNKSGTVKVPHSTQSYEEEGEDGEVVHVTDEQ